LDVCRSRPFGRIGCVVVFGAPPILILMNACEKAHFASRFNLIGRSRPRAQNILLS
jgi:hypothetical protein